MFRYLILLFLTGNLFGVISKTILVNNDQELIIELKIVAKTDADLFPTYFLVGLPNKDLPITDIVFTEPKKFPLSSKIKKQDEPFIWINRQKIQNLETASLRICPIDTKNTYFQKIKITLKFDTGSGIYRKPNKNESILLSNRIINWETAQKWIHKNPKFLNKRSNYPDGIWASFTV